MNEEIKNQHVRVGGAEEEVGGTEVRWINKEMQVHYFWTLTPDIHPHLLT